MQLCRAQCSSCYKSVMQTSSFACRCRDERNSDRHSAFDYWSTQNNTDNVRLPQSLCRDCNNMESTELLRLREKRERKTFAELSRLLMACGSCSQTLLRTGPLWWLCPKCMHECRSCDHLEWRGKLEV
jgi:hypothetical protein